MTCTVPWPLRKWFNARFADICAEHDAAYIQRSWNLKVTSDFRVAYRLASRGYYLLAYLSVIYLAVFGTIYWWWKK